MNITKIITEIMELEKKATPAPWTAAYHNRTETWSVTHPKEGCDDCNNKENLIVSIPNELSYPGSCSHSPNIILIAEMRNHIVQLCEALRDAERIIKDHSREDKIGRASLCSGDIDSSIAWLKKWGSDAI